MSEAKKPGEKDGGAYFYYERGLIVFTEAYHRARGHCCESGCRHCPFGYERKKRRPPSAKDNVGM